MLELSQSGYIRSHLTPLSSSSSIDPHRRISSWHRTGTGSQQSSDRSTVPPPPTAGASDDGRGRAGLAARSASWNNVTMMQCKQPVITRCALVINHMAKSKRGLGQKYAF